MKSISSTEVESDSDSDSDEEISLVEPAPKLTQPRQSNKYVSVYYAKKCDDGDPILRYAVDVYSDDGDDKLYTFEEFSNMCSEQDRSAFTGTPTAWDAHVKKEWLTLEGDNGRTRRTLNDGTNGNSVNIAELSMRKAAYDKEQENNPGLSV
jgi:hypothetical protein